MTDSVSYRPLLHHYGRTTTSGTDYLEAGLPSGSSVAASIPLADGEIYTETYNFETSSSVVAQGRSDGSTRNLNNSPNLFYTQASLGLYFFWTVRTNLASPRSGLTYQFRATTAPDEWSASNMPQDATDLQDIETAFTSASSNWVLNGSTYDLVFSLDFNTTYGSRPPISMAYYMSQPDWTGHLALTLVNNTGTGFSVLVAAGEDFNRGYLLGQYVPQFTGWSGHPPERGRPMRDMKTGAPTFTGDVQEDGYLPGIWTQAKSWDPDDPRHHTLTNFPSNESQPDDDVPV